MPLSTLQTTPHGVARKTRGQDGFATSFPVGLFHPLQHAGLSRRTPDCRPPCKSLSRENAALLRSAQNPICRTRRSSQLCLSAVGSCSTQNRTSIRCLGPAGRHRRLSLCSLPVLKQFEESLGSLISVAQSATAGPGRLRAV